MLDSVQLRLLIGPIVPLTPPRAVMDALTEVEVKVVDVGQSGFKLTFSIDKQSPLQILFLLTGGTPLLFMRVVVAVVVNGSTTVLVDGVITDNSIAPGDKGSNSTLTLMGKDLTALMDQSKMSGFPFPAMPAEARIALLLLKYAVFGVLPIVIPSVLLFVPLPIDQIPSQQGTDLEYIRYLADQAGYVFYIDPGPVPGISKAYWGPQIKVGLPQPALNTDLDAYTNVESMRFSFDQEKNKIPVLYISNPQTGISFPIPLPPITPLNPPLGAIPPLPTNLLPPDLTPFGDDIAKKPIPQAVMMGLARSAQNAECVSCDGSLDVTRYHNVLQARQLVGVRGAGPAFDGLYYVKSVTHKIKRGEYKQDFTLTRNGLVLDSPHGAPMSADASAGSNPRRFFGKYRGLVIANIDPEQTGRVMVQVPDVLGSTPSTWAMPCVPAAGIQAGFFIVPPIGSQVWVEFEQGDPDFPIWTGGFWGLAAQVPIFGTAPPPIPPGQNIVIQTTGQNMIIVSDSAPTPATGGIVLKSTTGAMLVVNDSGIYISNGKGAMITMVGPTVDVNTGALTVI